MKQLQNLLKHTDLLFGVGLVVVVAILILPLPHWALDMGLVVAIASAVIILLSSVNVTDPLQFSVFPSLLLVTTLFRLALSIAATKLILGTGQAGAVIETFGNFIMGGDFVVGVVAFLILVIVQFIVITNGAGRVSEVVARFTLDAMPGKQMAIDADLAAGSIDEEQAKERRENVKREADFYGAMDGASKFVKGDAIASILIIIINIIGGFAVGFMKGQGDALTIMKTYTLLSVGEGLVSQLPALLISTASGLLVTRSGQQRSMGAEVIGQMLGQPKALSYAGGALAVMGFVPGFPTMIFLIAAAACLGIGQFMEKTPGARKLVGAETMDEKRLAAKAIEAAAKQNVPQGPEAVLPLLTVDPLEIEIGHGLTKLADARVGGDISERVTSTRKQIALELGFVMPTVRIRDSIHLKSTEYAIKVRGEEVARAEIIPNMHLAISGGEVFGSVPGITTKDPVFGLDAIWIDPANRETAERSGYSVIEPSAVLTTHLGEVVKAAASELLTRQDVFKLIEHAKLQNESAVTELIPNVLTVGDVQKVLQHLLRERVPIRDMVTILETMADFGTRVKDPDQLGELVRANVARTITRQFVDPANKLACITLDPALERDLVDNVNLTNFGSMLVITPDQQRDLMESIRAEVDRANVQGFHAVLLCGNQLRLPLKRLVEKQLPTLAVMAYNEVAETAEVEFVGQLRAFAA
jgi:flagellar biosynthesis protein FlhA